MNEWVTVALLGLGLSMDAFAAAVSEGLSIRPIRARHYFFIAGVFGLMQGVMPVIGYFTGRLIGSRLQNAMAYISFALLLILGGKMIFEGIRSLKKKETLCDKPFKPFKLLVTGVATSLDALFAGVSLASLSVNVFAAGGIIAGITFCLSLLGVLLGVKAGRLIGNKCGIADLIGGTLLIALGVKFLLSALLGI